MSVFLETNRRKKINFTYSILLVVAILLGGYTLFTVFSKSSPNSSSLIQVPNSTDPIEIRKLVSLPQAEPPNKNVPLPVGIQSRLFRIPFTQKSLQVGRSPENLKIAFEAPVDIHGITINNSFIPESQILKISVGLNQMPAYQEDPSQGNILGFWRFRPSTEGHEQAQGAPIWFPLTYTLLPADSLNVGAWFQNGIEEDKTITTDILIYFSWKDEGYRKKW